MSNPDVKDEAGDRARLIERTPTPAIRIYVSADAIAVPYWNAEQMQAALSSDANDKRIADLEAKFSAMLKAEHDLSDAYLRLRKIVPGGLNTAGLRGEDIWEHVELCALGLVARAEAAESQLRLTGTEEAGVRALVETMHAEMRHDEITGNPLWFCTEADGRGEVSELHTVELAADLFPEGTVISITEPLKPFRRT